MKLQQIIQILEKTDQSQKISRLNIGGISELTNLTTCHFINLTLQQIKLRHYNELPNHLKSDTNDRL